ncbi:hypothetical protein [Maridesulfovibrio sp.]|uniref:hypothetical protein n=1 Tax=Maridesulfovibrio sp. TaxID=2795000 RepID=UPI002A18A638|nr:hypothetical protein [Maridesulfovibrio sp.]
MGVSWGVRVRVVILFLLGAILSFPGALLVLSGFMEPDMGSDDALAMFFMGGLLSFCGLLIWWMMRKVYRRGKYMTARMCRTQDDEDAAMGMAMAQTHYIASTMHDSADNDFDSGDVDSDIDTDFDSGGDFDIND